MLTTSNTIMSSAAAGSAVRRRRRHSHASRAAKRAAAGAEAVSPLVALLAGNPATSFALLQALNPRDATVLRRLHPR